jgi:hypothetical protein
MDDPSLHDYLMVVERRRGTASQTLLPAGNTSLSSPGTSERAEG